ncbi:MAG: flagellar biosynthesis anti-sigma factor FlgM [Desulfobacterales bacterium]|jgi:anti-sigma28 factor (negative regulator of flagellin synthesis)
MKAVSGSTGGGEVLQMTAFARKPAGPPNISGLSLSGANPFRQETPVVRISTTSRMAQVARSAALSAPEIRVEAVEPLRDALNAGRYDFSPQRVAEKMVGGCG